MSHVATLVANPAAPQLAPALVQEAAGHLPEARIRWLAPGVAADIAFTIPNLADPAATDEASRALLDGIAEDLRDFVGAAPVDVVVQPNDRFRRKRLFLADMDSTMIEQECIDELADFVGLKGEVSRITERAMRGELPFEPALRERVALLKGLPLAVVDEIIAARIRLTPGGRTLVHTLRANGAYTCLVSGGFTLFTGPIAGMIGFDEHRSNRLVVADERLAGAVEEPILGREAKIATLIELRGRLGLDHAQTLAVGDGANDLAMLGEAGFGIAFRAKPAVAAAAHARIDHGDLTALLYVQGYHIAEFVTD